MLERQTKLYIYFRSLILIWFSPNTHSRWRKSEATFTSSVCPGNFGTQRTHQDSEVFELRRVFISHLCRYFECFCQKGCWSNRSTKPENVIEIPNCWPSNSGWKKSWVWTTDHWIIILLTFLKGASCEFSSDQREGTLSIQEYFSQWIVLSYYSKSYFYFLVCSCKETYRTNIWNYTVKM